MKAENRQLTKQCVLCGKKFTMLLTKITKGKQKGKGEWRVPKDVCYFDVPATTFSDGVKREGFEYWECPKCAV